MTRILEIGESHLPEPESRRGRWQKIKTKLPDIFSPDSLKRGKDFIGKGVESDPIRPTTEGITFDDFTERLKRTLSRNNETVWGVWVEVGDRKELVMINYTILTRGLDYEGLGTQDDPYESRRALNVSPEVFKRLMYYTIYYIYERPVEDSYVRINGEVFQLFPSKFEDE